MKRLFATLSLVLMVSFVLASGCSTLSADNDWVEVQSITYSTDKGKNTLTSKYSWNTDSVDIEQAEYDNAPAEYQKEVFEDYLEYPQVLNINRKEEIENFNKTIGFTFFYCIHSRYVDSLSYRKITYNSYTINYVKIKLDKDGSIEVNYNEETTKVLPTSYEITYFTD